MTKAHLPPRGVRRAWNRSAAYQSAQAPDERLAKAFDWLRAAIKRHPEHVQTALAEAAAKAIAARAAELDTPPPPNGVARHDY